MTLAGPGLALTFTECTALSGDASQRGARDSDSNHEPEGHGGKQDTFLFLFRAKLDRTLLSFTQTCMDLIMTTLDFSIRGFKDPAIETFIAI